MIEAEELGGSSTTYMSDYHYSNNSAAVRIARAGGSSVSGGNAGPFALSSDHGPSTSATSIGAALVLPY